MKEVGSERPSGARRAQECVRPAQREDRQLRMTFHIRETLAPADGIEPPCYRLTIGRLTIRRRWNSRAERATSPRTLVPNFQGAGPRRWAHVCRAPRRRRRDLFRFPQALTSLVPGLGFEPNLLGSEPSVLPNRRSRNGAGDACRPVHLKGFAPLPHRLRTECAAATPQVQCSQAQLDVFHDFLLRMQRRPRRAFNSGRPS